MQRIAFILKIKPEMKEEYKKAHDNIWPELKENMQFAGIRNFSIYFKRDALFLATMKWKIQKKPALK